MPWAEGDPASGLDLAHPLIHAPRSLRRIEEHVLEKSLWSQPRRCAPGQQRLGLAREQQFVFLSRVEERFHSKSIPNKDQPSPIPEGSREHSVEALEKARAFAGKADEQDLGIRRRAKPVPTPDEIASEFSVVVDLPIE